MSDIALKLAERVGRPRIPMAKIAPWLPSISGRPECGATRNRVFCTATLPCIWASMLAVGTTTRIGRFYNGRDHSTVCYAVRRIESLRRSDTTTDTLIVKFMELCQQGVAEQPTASVFKKVIRHHLDDALIEELVDRIRESTRTSLAAIFLPGSGDLGVLDGDRDHVRGAWSAGGGARNRSCDA